ncbi:hypothetical protein EK21DRAFT_94246 [Setomelanomma holmii]|uniref:Transmembrane protein n=1 Tax=Setomelanomma holmii TaxID=210430 RepID=A0A9P4LGC7_9PLEO|nr:hypothetical protein EK21DRAFT_94246 [Setomelanomma holmii]
MAPYPVYPYIPKNITTPSTTPTLTNFTWPSPLPSPSTISSNLTNPTIVAHVSVPNPTPTLISGEAGTSPSTPGIVAIIAAVVFLFGGLAWFAWHALITLPRRKKMLIKERRRQRRADRREDAEGL